MKNFGLLLMLPSSLLLAQPVSEKVMLDVGENELYLEIAGQSMDAPLLLYLHGGPGNVVAGVLPFQANVGQQLEQDFLVAYLHQRGAGKSSPVPASEQTVSAHIRDLEKVVDLLTEQYDQDRVYLLGHSWGAILAAVYADGHREDVEKLVLMSATVNVRSQFRDSREATLEWARGEEIAEAIEQLSGVDVSFETTTDTGVVGRWASQARGGIGRRFDMGLIERFTVNIDYPNWQERTAEIGRAMIEETLEIDLHGAIASFDIPALFVSGALDTVVPETSMRRDYARYGGKKEFALLEDSHHLPFIDEPDKLVQAVREFLLE
jgi:proline iminopeptidase